MTISKEYPFKFNNPLIVKMKRAPDVPEDWPLPEYHSEGAGCFDLMAYIPDTRSQALRELDFPNHQYLDNVRPLSFRTGLIFEVPEDFVMLIYSRSGHGFNKDVRLSNCVGVVDSDYRGELRIKLIQDFQTPYGGLEVRSGDRIAQGMILPVPKVQFQWDELTETKRGEGGYGSTGR